MFMYSCVGLLFHVKVCWVLRWTDPIIVKQDKKTAKTVETFLIPWGLVCFSCWLRVSISDRRDRSQYEDCLHRGNPVT